MELVKPIVKKELKFNRACEILAELEELKAVKSTYFHFLGTYYSQLYCDNVPQVQENYNKVCGSINALTMEYRLLQAEILAATPKAVEPVRVVHSPLEQLAILNFNKDRRFSITE